MFTQMQLVFFRENPQQHVCAEAKQRSPPIGAKGYFVIKELIPSFLEFLQRVFAILQKALYLFLQVF